MFRANLAMMSTFSRNLKHALIEKPELVQLILAQCKLNESQLDAFIAGFEEPSFTELVTISSILNRSLDELIRYNLSSEVQTDKIRMLVLDVDGVMTDGGMYYSESGDQFKKFDTKDGMGIKLAMSKGIRIAFLSSGSNSNLILSRAATLGVSVVHVGSEQKFEILSGWCKEFGIGLDEVAFIGDDVNDLECISKVGFAACPANAVDDIKRVVTVVLTRNGGAGCVREFVDRFLPR